MTLKYTFFKNTSIIIQSLNIFKLQMFRLLVATTILAVAMAANIFNFDSSLDDEWRAYLQTYKKNYMFGEEVSRSVTLSASLPPPPHNLTHHLWVGKVGNIRTDS